MEKTIDDYDDLIIDDRYNLLMTNLDQNIDDYVHLLMTVTTMVSNIDGYYGPIYDYCYGYDY